MSTPNGDKLVDMNFKVPAQLHRRFKIEAVQRGMTMRDLVEAAFRVYLEQHPLTEKPSDLF
jgi:predicted HicB family RNase H-like nuclease